VTRVKICGLTNTSDALFAARKGADFLGFVFYPRSPRNVSPEAVRRLVTNTKAELPSVICVGLFVDESAETVCQILAFCDLDRAQLHGGESAETLASLEGRAFKAIRPRSLLDAESAMAQYAPCPSPPDLLIDTYDVKVAGGSGQVGDWRTAAHIASERKILLAGGLTPDNVEEAVQVVKPWGVDVSSGVEAEPGRKSHQAIAYFINRVKKHPKAKED
jgi:phosphoribosylanthranilate isomerase